jgi:hypothetical protein
LRDGAVSFACHERISVLHRRPDGIGIDRYLCLMRPFRLSIN